MIGYVTAERGRRTHSNRRDDKIIAAAINEFGGMAVTSNPVRPVSVTAAEVARTRQLLRRVGSPTSTRALTWRVARAAGALEDAADRAAKAASAIAASAAS